MNTKSSLFFIFAVTVFCFFTQNIFAQLSGTYTIDPKGSGATNYKNFLDAAADLNTNGVTGPVVIKVANGTYKEIFELDSIAGASATNTITFESASGDSSKVILLYPRGKTSNYMMELNNAAWFTFKQLTFKTTSDTGQYLVLTTNGCSNINFLNNRFILTYANGYGIITTIKRDTNILIKNNLIKYGQYGLSLAAKTLTIENNILDSIYSEGMSVSGVSNIMIRNNTISNLQLGAGMVVGNCKGNLIIVNNRISSSSDGSGITLSQCYGSPSAYQYIYNNFITFIGTGSNGDDDGLYVIGCAFQKIEFNNFLNTNSGYSMVLGGGTHTYVQNNNFVNKGSYGYALKIDSPNVKSLRLDYNNYYYKSYCALYNGTAYNTLSDYQSGAAQDKHSISVDPKYVSSTNLHIRDSALIYAGTPVSGITTDIDGDLRNPKAPTIGADEIPSSGCTSAFNTASSVCLGDTSYFTDASTFIYQDSIANWSWNFGDTSAGSTLRNPKHVYRYAGTDTVQFYVATKSGLTCKSSQVITVSSVCYMTLSGIVKTSLDSVLKNSKIYLCTFNSADTTVKVLDSVLADSFGAYSFSTAKDSVYLLAMPNFARYPHEMPTWSDSGLVFPDANEVVLHHGTTVKNFKTIYGANPGGSGFIGGKILSCPLCKANAPVVHLRVILADSNGKAQEYTYTDANGAFEFKNIAPTKYKILVDRPHVDNRKAPVVDINNYSSGKLAFTLYPTYLDLDIATVIEKQLNDATISIYPNPANSVLYLNIMDELSPPLKGVRGMTSTFVITDLSGKTLLTQQIHSQETAIDISTLPVGIYLIRYQDSEKVWNGKFVKE